MKNKNLLKQSGSFLLEAGIGAAIIALTTIGGVALYKKTLAFQGSYVENQEITAMTEAAIDTVRAYGRDYYQYVKETNNSTNIDNIIQQNFKSRISGFAGALSDKINATTANLSTPGQSIWADWQSQYLTRRIKFTNVGQYDSALKGLPVTVLVCWASQTGESNKCTGQNQDKCIPNKCQKEFPTVGQSGQQVFKDAKVDGIEVNTIITAY